MSSLNEDVIGPYNFFVKEIFKNIDIDTLYKHSNINDYTIRYENFIEELKKKSFFKNLKKDEYITLKKDLIQLYNNKYILDISEQEKILYIANYTAAYIRGKHILEKRISMYNRRSIIFFHFFDQFFTPEILFTCFFKVMFTPLTKGTFGTIYKTDFTMAVKVSEYNINNLHEEFIGKTVINNIIDTYQIPNLIYTFTSYNNKDFNIKNTNINMILDKNEKLNNYIFYDKKLYNMLIIEEIPNNITLKKYLSTFKDILYEDFKDIYSQVMLTLYLCNMSYKMCHNDLHTENVLLVKSEDDLTTFKFPIYYTSDYVMKKTPKYIAKIIDYNTCSGVIEGKYYYPFINEFIINNIDNDIYKITLTCYIDIYSNNFVNRSVKEKIITFLEGILMKYFMDKFNYKEIENNDKIWRNYIFKRKLKFNIESSLILNELIEEYKINNNRTIKIVNIDLPQLYSINKVDSTNKHNIEYLYASLFSFYYLKYIQNYFNKENVIWYVTKIYKKIFDKKNYNKFFTSSVLRRFHYINHIKSFVQYFSTISMINKSNIDDLEYIMKDYTKEYGRKFDKEKYWNWYKGISPYDDKKFFYIVYMAFGDDIRLLLGHIGFELKEDGKYYIAIYINKEYVSSKLGSLLFYKGIYQLFEDTKEVCLRMNASIFKDNVLSIKFFEKNGFQKINETKKVTVLNKVFYLSDIEKYIGDFVETNA